MLLLRHDIDKGQCLVAECGNGGINAFPFCAVGWQKEQFPVAQCQRIPIENAAIRRMTKG